MGRDSSVGIVTGYGFDGPGIESRWRRDFPHMSRPALRITQPPEQRVPGLHSGLKWPQRGVDHPPPSSAQVTERVELYIYVPFGPKWPALWWALTLLLPLQQQLRAAYPNMGVREKKKYIPFWERNSMRMPETCWAVFKWQVINSRSCCIWLVDSVERTTMHGLANTKCQYNFS